MLVVLLVAVFEPSVNADRLRRLRCPEKAPLLSKVTQPDLDLSLAAREFARSRQHAPTRMDSPKPFGPASEVKDLRVLFPFDKLQQILLSTPWS